MKHHHTNRTADYLWTFVLTVTTVAALLLILHPDRIAAYDDAPDTTEPTETTTWPSTPESSAPPATPPDGPTPTSTTGPPVTSLSPSTSTPHSSEPATATTAPPPSPTVSVGPAPTWSCPADSLIRRADTCEVDPCSIRPDITTSDYQLGHAVDGRNGATVAYVVPCHIPAQHTASPPALELPATGMSGPLWAIALGASAAGAALVALARRKQVTP